MHEQAYVSSQPLDGYDARRGQNSDGYHAWVYDMVWPKWPAWYWEALRDLAETPAVRAFRLAVDESDAAHE